MTEGRGGRVKKDEADGSPLYILITSLLRAKAVVVDILRYHADLCSSYSFKTFDREKGGDAAGDEVARICLVASADLSMAFLFPQY